jgi:hypothetical protein
MALRPGSAQKAQRQALEAKANDRAADDNLALLIAYFEDSEEVTQDSRKLSERDRDYYDNKQLTSDEIAVLKKRGQPEIIINRIQTKVNFLLGYEASQRTDPRGYPRTPMDEDAAGAFTDTLRYVRDKSDMPQVFSAAWEDMLVEGFCGAECGVIPDTMGDAEITIDNWPWDRLFYDPHSRKHDFSDARYLGGVIWMDEDEAIAKWPDGKNAIARTISEDGTQTYSDRPSWKQWSISGKRKRVRVVQMYYLQGDTWHWCIFTRGGKLAGGEVPYRDEDNKSLCPMILQSAFVDRQNNRYGFVRALIGPQDEINKRRSKSLHLLMGKPFKYEDGALDDVDEAKAEMGKANGGIKVNPGFNFEFLDNSQELSGHLGLLQEAKNEIDLMGPNAVLQGKGERGSSGRAKMIDQQGGQTEIYRLIDRHAHFKRRVYKLIWAMIRQYWTKQKWIRVTDDENNIKFVGLNRPVTMAEDLLNQAVNNGVDMEEAKAQIAQQAQDPMVRMQLQQVVRTENVPAEMNMDIILEEVPDSANLQQEQFEILANLATAGVVFPPKVYVQASALRNKAEMLKVLEEAQSDPANQAAGQAQLEKLMAEIEKLKADIADTKASAIKKLAEADAVDKQFGTVIDPQIVRGGAASPGSTSPGQQSTPALMGPGFSAASPASNGQPMSNGMPAGGIHQMPDGSMMADSDMAGGYGGQPMAPQSPQQF